MRLLKIISQISRIVLAILLLGFLIATGFFDYNIDQEFRNILLILIALYVLNPSK